MRNSYNKESETQWTNGKKNGIKKYFYKSGTLQEEIPYVNDKVNGLVKKFYGEDDSYVRNSNPQIKTIIPYIDDKREGTLKSYYKNGALKQEDIYKNDKLVSGKGYRETGHLKYLIEVKKDNQIQTEYDEKGKVWATITNSLNGKIINGICGDGRKWTEAEKHNWENGLSVSCSYPTK